MTEPKKKGRPCKLTPEVQKRIVDALRGGNFRETAAKWAGVSPGVVSQWMSRKGEPYESFQRAVDDAEQGAEVRSVALIMKAAAEDPKHAQWWLERKFPERWGRKERYTVTGPGGGPLAVAIDVTKLSDEELERIIAGK